jgi:hypothetical protein
VRDSNSQRRYAPAHRNIKNQSKTARVAYSTYFCKNMAKHKLLATQSKTISNNFSRVVARIIWVKYKKVFAENGKFLQKK